MRKVSEQSLKPPDTAYVSRPHIIV